MEKRLIQIARQLEDIISYIQENPILSKKDGAIHRLHFLENEFVEVIDKKLAGEFKDWADEK